jgi:osmotically-inducible protein OsmY
MKTDSEIQIDVMQELTWEPLLNASEIGVAVKNGIVTLTGTVNSYPKKLAAENAAKRIEGVKAVAEEIEIIPLTSHRRSDAEIADAILTSLKWHTAFDANKIKVKVENGWVTLEGELEWIFQKAMVVSCVENLMGVRGITNLIKITPMVEPEEIRRKISAAFHRHATIDAKGINIKTDGNKVTLTGKVNTFTEKMEASNAAASAPGIAEVINKLEVEEEVFA